MGGISTGGRAPAQGALSAGGGGGTRPAGSKGGPPSGGGGTAANAKTHRPIKSIQIKTLLFQGRPNSLIW